MSRQPSLIITYKSYDPEDNGSTKKIKQRGKKVKLNKKISRKEIRELIDKKRQKINKQEKGRN